MVEGLSSFAWRIQGSDFPWPHTATKIWLRRLIDSISLLSSRHRVLVVAFSDYELAELIDAKPERADDLYRQAVAASSGPSSPTS